MAQFVKRSNEWFDQQVWRPRLFNRQWAISAALIIGAGVAGFKASEIWQDVVMAPATISKLRPEIIVKSMAAHEHHAVERATAPQHLAGRPHVDTSATRKVWLGEVMPIHVRPWEGEHHESGNADEWVVMVAPCFQQQDAALRIF